MEIAIIGAGMAGLSCARTLAEAGVTPQIFDKGRGLGGRMATRRTDDGAAFDHGAPYFAATDRDFRAFVADMMAQGAVAEWDVGRRHLRYLGTPGMTALAKSMAADLHIDRRCEITGLEKAPSGWTLSAGDQRIDTDIVVSTAPAPQTAALLGAPHALTDQINTATYDPCLTLMITLDAPLLSAATVVKEPTNPLAHIIQNNAKPMRPSQAAYVVHASPDWSRAHLEYSKDDITVMMRDLFCAHFDISADRVLHAAAHRWRYAQVAETLGQPFVRTQVGDFYAGGDWCLGPNVQAAWLSGRAIAQDILKQAGRP